MFSSKLFKRTNKHLTYLGNVIDVGGPTTEAIEIFGDNLCPEFLQQHSDVLVIKKLLSNNSS